MNGLGFKGLMPNEFVRMGHVLCGFLSTVEISIDRTPSCDLAYLRGASGKSHTGVRLGLDVLESMTLDDLELILHSNSRLKERRLLLPAAKT